MLAHDDRVHECLRSAGLARDDRGAAAVPASRNQIILCRNPRGRRVLIKVGREHHGAGILKESFILGVLGPRLVRSRDVALPHVVYRASSPPMVGLKWVVGSETLFDHHKKRPDRTLALATNAGRALGRAHQESIDARAELFPAAAAFTGSRGNEFFIRIPPRTFAVLSPASVRFFAFLQAHHPVLSSLQTMAAIAFPSSSACLVHGDFKLANLLCRPSRPRAPLVLLDWELAHWGDPATDLGGMVCDYALYWMAPESTAAALSLESLTTILAALFAGYAQPRSASKQDPELLLRSMLSAGVTLLYYVYGLAQFDNDFGARAQRLAEFAIAFLTDPAKWAGKLIGAPG